MRTSSSVAVPVFIVLLLLFSNQPLASQTVILPVDAGSGMQERTNIAIPPEASIVLPVGTKVLTALISPLHTVSASVGSGVYLETSADVIQQNRVVIPVHARVQGSITGSERPGRIKGRGHLQFHFTTIILPNNYVVPISGSLQSLPGSTRYEKKLEGMIRPVDQIDKDIATIVDSAAGGSAIAAVSRGSASTITGALLGSAFGLGKVLVTRGDDITLREGTKVEMVLDREVTVPISKLDFVATRPESSSIRTPSDETERSVIQNRKKGRRGLGSILFPLP